MNEIELFFNTIQTGNLKNVKLQINRNPKLVNTKDARGFTPLILAAYFDKLPIVKFLLENKAPIDATDSSGNTALIGVSFKGNIELMTCLIENGANINAINNNGTSSLIFTAMYNKEASAAFLLQHKPDKTIQDNLGKTALDYAKEKGFTNIVKLLDN